MVKNLRSFATIASSKKYLVQLKVSKSEYCGDMQYRYTVVSISDVLDQNTEKTTLKASDSDATSSTNFDNKPSTGACKVKKENAASDVHETQTSLALK